MKIIPKSWFHVALPLLAVTASSIGWSQAKSAAPARIAAVDTPSGSPEDSISTAKSDNASQLNLEEQLKVLQNRVADLERLVLAQRATALEDSKETSALKSAEKDLLADKNNPQPKAEHASLPSAAEAALHAPPASTAPEIPAEVTTKSAPFGFADWTWLNGNPRTVDTPLATKYFTPEFRADVNYTYDFNRPKDDSMGGSTETFRSTEVQIEQLSFGGDLRVHNVRGRFLTMYGMFATTTPRNDPSVARGQWDLANAYRYVSEAWGGYHWDVSHGLNLDGGIFVSYIGLFSYYNFDNWAYQPSYVSSNTPWFFNGLRLQWFPTEKLKIEPWFINGWQAYARSNSKPGLGGQILWRPNPKLSLVFNNYGLGEDAPGILSGGATQGRSRIHTDDSVQYKYYDRSGSFLDKMAFTFTGDLGCEYGGGVSCTGKGHNPKQAFLGWMGYNRMWFKKDLYGLTIGGGQMNNPGRYLTLLPPINGATAVTGTPYFTENPGDKAHAYDGTVTFDYMPTQFITFRIESGYRHFDVPYWTGRGGITPPGGNNGFPAQYACTVAGPGGNTASGFTDLGSAQTQCANLGGSVWFPDLRKQQITGTAAVMVKF